MPRPRKFPIVMSTRHAKVTVYRTTNGSYTSYKIVWNEGRRRKKESRSCETVAVARAQEILDDLNKGVESRPDATAEQWAYYRNCEEMLGDIPLKTAVEYYLRHAGKETGPQILISDLVQKFIESCETKRKSDRYLETLGHHLRPLGDLFRKPVARLKVEELDEYLASIPNARTRSNHRTSIVTMFRWAKTKGWLPRDRASVAELTDSPEVTHKEPGILAPEELGRVLRRLEEVNPDLIPYVVIGAFAGARSAEISRLSWDLHIDLDQRVIKLPSSITKTRRRRVVHMDDTLFAWLMEYKSEGMVVKLAKPQQALASVRGDTPWPHNALRHSAVSYLMALHRDAAHVAEQCGHTEAELQSSYKALATPNDAREWFALRPNPNTKRQWLATQEQPKAARA